MSITARPSYCGRYTFALHFRAASLDAVATEVLLLNEFVAREALGASALAITVLLMLPSLPQMLNLYSAGTSGHGRRARSSPRAGIFTAPHPEASPSSH